MEKKSLYPSCFNKGFREKIDHGNEHNIKDIAQYGFIFEQPLSTFIIKVYYEFTFHARDLFYLDPDSIYLIVN